MSIRSVGHVAIIFMAACGSKSGGDGGDGGGNGGVAACSDTLMLGQACSATGARTLSLGLDAHQYVQVSTKASGAAAPALSGGYAGETLREAAEGPDLAFYNPGDGPITAQIVVDGTGSLIVTAQAHAFELSTSCSDADCGTLLQVPLPREADGYRTISPTRYQFGRRELVQNAIAAVTAIRRANPTLAPVGIADLSQKDGQVPGTDVNVPRHVYPAHAGGYAIDIGYYRTKGDNLGNPACPTTSDGMFCAGPHDLDVARNVEFFRSFTTNLHAIQLLVDPVMEADVRAELARQADADPLAVARGGRMLQSGSAFPYHDDHFHVAFTRAPVAVSSLQAEHFGAESAVAVGPAGDVMVAFMLLDDPNAFGYAYSSNFGIDWQPTRLLRAPGGRNANDPSLAVDSSGNFYITMIALRLPPSDAHVYWAKAPAGTGTFGTVGEVTVPTDNFGYDRPNIKISPQGIPVVTYARGVAGGESLDTIMIATAPDGAQFSSTALVGPTPPASRNFAMLCSGSSGGRMYLVYGDSGAVWLQSSTDGQNWNTAARVQVFTQTTSDPRCAADGNDVWILDAAVNVFPPAGQPTLRKLLLRHSGDGGQNLDPIVTVADGGATSLFMLGNVSVGFQGLVDVTYYEGASDGDTHARFQVARARSRAADSFWPTMTLYSPVILRTGYGPRWLGDYTGNLDALGILSFAIADGTGDSSRVMFGKVLLP